MSSLLSALAMAAPLAAGWSVHTAWMCRRLVAARRDPLTRMPTRAGFETAAARLLRRGAAVVVLVDLDGFKQLNDQHGHAAGDAALIGTAAAFGDLQDGHPGMAVGRLGGDEFAAVVPVAAAHGLPWLLEGLHDALCAPLAYQGRTLTVGASVGGVFAAAGTALPVALRAADEAMYAAKRAGGGWRAAPGLTPTCVKVNGRRFGRSGTAGRDGGAW